MKNANLVSVCIPTYNGEKYLQEALDSVKTQTYKDIEVIISDDGSNDGTLDICNNFKNEVSFPVHVFHHTPNGIGKNWNNCIKNAKGEYIKFLFQDDVLFPHCVEKQLDVMIKNNLKAVCSKRVIIDENSDVLHNEWVEKYGDLQKDLHIPDQDVYIFSKERIKLLTDLVYNIFGEPDTFLYSRYLFKKIGFFHQEYKQMLDLEFSYRILQNYPIGIINERLIYFRNHAEQATAHNMSKPSEEYSQLNNRILGDFFWNLNKNKKKQYLLLKFPLLQRLIVFKNRFL